MNLIRTILVAVCVTLSFSSAVQAKEGMRVAFLNPGGQGDDFFGMMTSFMQAAADDLGIDLEVIYCDRNHLKMRDEGKRLLARKELPEYLLLVNEKNAGVDLLREASEKGVKVALINEGLQESDVQILGDPGDILHNWVLELLPDDHQAGYLLAKALIHSAEDNGLVDSFGHVKIVGIAGTFQTGSSSSRVNGLRQAVKENPKAILQQVAPALWEEDRAREVTTGLISRYPDTTVIWSASDLMARGAHDAYHETFQLDHKGMVTGGIDWADVGLSAVRNGDFAATVGGHFMDGGWALVMLYDYHNGVALTQTRIRTSFSLITQDNVQEYIDRFGENDWNSIDFSKFSKQLNPDVSEYSFGLSAVLNQLNK